MTRLTVGSALRGVPRRSLAVGVAFAGFLGLAALAYACNVPVFRFALERWRPDPYRVVLLHKGPLTAADLEKLRPLEEHDGQSLANLSLRTIDVDELAKSEGDDEALAGDRELVKAFGEGELPKLVVLYPESLKIGKPVWTGPLSRELVVGLLVSPARQELVKRLVGGQTAVWILLEPAGNEPGGEALALLEAELPKLQAELKLPELSAAPEDELLIQTPLRVEFSVLRVRRDDPAEQSLVAMLIGSEPDLAERNDPMVFPVFGRGRALLPLIGAGISANNIHDGAEFLVGACSCEVKELNPGFDLLLATDWEERLASGGERLVTPAAATATEGPPVLLPIPAGAPPATVTVNAPVVVHSYGMGFTAKLLLVGVAGLVGLVLIVVLVAASHSAPRRD